MRLAMRNALATLGIPLVVIIACSMVAGAAVGVSWARSDVIPVVLVKPGITGFEPVEGTSIGNTWSKAQVKAVLLVKPGIGGFEPREGTTTGNTWRKDDILPVMLVEPSANSFVPLHTLEGELADNQVPAPSSRINAVTTLHTDAAIPSVIESQLSGEFSGWEGETIVRLTNGQIWQQSEYYYHYYYAFMPKVLIYKSGRGYKMKVDGVEKAVGVIRLK